VKKNKTSKNKVPPRFELGLLDSESNVLTARPWDHLWLEESTGALQTVYSRRFAVHRAP
jgi:hypothetical protein